jgi:hypothetical protein
LPKNHEPGTRSALSPADPVTRVTRALHRQSPGPERDRKFLKPALALLEIAGVDIGEREIY